MTGTWMRVVIFVVLAVVALRTVQLVGYVARRRRPWTRLLLPLAILLEGIGACLHAGIYWQLRVGTAVVLELLVIGIAIRELRRTSHDPAPVKLRIACALEALVPAAMANLIAFEIVIVATAARFAAGGWRRAAPIGFTYHRNSGLRMLLPMLPLLAVADVLLLELVILPHAAPWLRVLVHVIAVYGLVWLVGLYASCRALPHVIRDGVLTAHRGLLGHANIALAEIESVAAMPTFTDDWKKRSYCRGAIRLDVPGASVLEMHLRAPVHADGVIGPQAPARRVLLAVDEPTALLAALS